MGFIKLVAIALIAVIGVLVFNTIQLKSVQPKPSGKVPQYGYSREDAVKRLSTALQFKTISYEGSVEARHSDNSSWTWKEFDGFLDFLKNSFPLVHSKLYREKLPCRYTLLFKWVGSDATLKPMLLMSHMDVVPIAEGTEQDWIYPPFQGTVADGYIWGRGALDIKSGVLSIFEAAEYLLSKGDFQPKRTIYFAFGHDEEVGGREGIVGVVEHLKANGVDRLEFVVDEGGSGTVGMLEGISANVSLIGISEKGYVTAELRATSEGGHSSMPPKESTIGILSRAIVKIEDNPMSKGITDGFKEMLLTLAPEMPLVNRVFIANLWLFEPLLVQLFKAKPSTNSQLGTTIVPTLIYGGNKDNVLPQVATAVVNSRIHTRDTVASVLKHLQDVIKDDRVKVLKRPGGFQQDSSPISRTDTLGYHILTQTIANVFPKGLVAPYCTSGATDSRYFYTLTDSVYRYMPYHMNKEDLARIHGTNERVGVDDYTNMITFFIHLLENTQHTAFPLPRHDEL